MDSDSIIDPDTYYTLKPVFSNLTILLRDDLYIINDLNNSLLQCTALSLEENELVISSSARLLIQGKLKTV